MAIIACNLKREGRTGNHGVSSSREYQIPWQVLTNSDNDGPRNVIAVGPFIGPDPLPLIGATYSVGNDTDTFSVCQNLAAVNVPGRVREWTVTATFKPLEPNQEQQDVVSTNPITRPIKYRLEHESWTRVTEKDKDGVALKNSANVPFDTGVELEDSYVVLVAEKNFATLQQIIDLNVQFALKVNNAVFKGGAVRSWLCRPITCSDLQNENGVAYYTATFHIVHKPDLWDIQVVDRGFLTKDGAVWKGALEKNLQPVGEAIPFNGAGSILNAGLPLHFLSFRIRGETSFTGLGI